MDSKVLAELVAEVIRTGNQRILSEDEKARFYREFESNLTEQVERMRSEKRRAYEELKNIAIR